MIEFKMQRTAQVSCAECGAVKVVDAPMDRPMGLILRDVISRRWSLVGDQWNCRNCADMAESSRAVVSVVVLKGDGDSVSYSLLARSGELLGVVQSDRETGKLYVVDWARSLTPKERRGVEVVLADVERRRSQ